jgi:hypothetical protein
MRDMPFFLQDFMGPIRGPVPRLSATAADPVSMSWGDAIMWGALIVAVLLGALLAFYFAIEIFSVFGTLGA